MAVAFECGRVLATAWAETVPGNCSFLLSSAYEQLKADLPVSTGVRTDPFLH